MPTIGSSNLPTPKSWDEFEDIALSAAKLRWKSTDFFRHGRQGQKQDGVDIWGHDDKKRHIGVQCKNTTHEITLALVKAEVKSARKFSPRLDRLYVATSAKRDAPLQKAVRTLSSQSKKAGRFAVDVLFWDDVCQDLAGDEDIVFKHFPQFRRGFDAKREHDKTLFNELTALLNSDGVIGFLRDTNMAGFSFPSAALDPLLNFEYNWNKPEREFINPELEALRRSLWEKICEYTAITSQNTFPTNTLGRITVPPEWELENPEGFKRVVDSLHRLAGEIVAIHRELVRAGRAHVLDGA